jgi:hypothetical protein
MYCLVSESVAGWNVGTVLYLGRRVKTGMGIRGLQVNEAWAGATSVAVPVETAETEAGTERQVSTAVGKTEGTTSGMRGVGNSGSARTAGDEVTVATISDFENNVATGEAKAVVAVMAMASREVCMFALGSL